MLESPCRTERCFCRQCRMSIVKHKNLFSCKIAPVELLQARKASRHKGNTSVLHIGETRRTKPDSADQILSFEIVNEFPYRLLPILMVLFPRFLPVLNQNETFIVNDDSLDVRTSQINSNCQFIFHIIHTAPLKYSIRRQWREPVLW